MSRSYQIRNSVYTRRQLIKRGLIGGAGLSGAALLAACGGSNNNNKSAAPSSPAASTSGGAATSAAAAPSAAPANLSGQLIYYTEDTAPNEIAWYTSLNAALKKDYPNIEPQDNNLDVGKDFFPKLQTALAAHMPPDMATVINIASCYTMWSQGVLDPAEDLIAAIGKDKFDPSALSSTQFDNHSIGVPVDQSANVLWYRTDLAQQAGVKPPTNWQEWLDFAKKLTANGVYGTVFPWSRQTITNRNFLTLARNNGGGIVDPDLKVIFDSPQNAEALDFYKQLSQYSPPGAVDYGFGEERDAFYTGKVASLVYAGRIAIEINAKNPSLADKIGAVAIPAGKTPWVSASPYLALVFKEARHKDLAKLFITKYMFNQDLYIQWLNVLPGQNLTTIPSYKQSAAYTNEPTRKKYPEIMKLLDDQAAAAAGTTGFLKETPKHKANPQSGALDQGTVIADVVQNALVKGQSSKTAIADGAKKIADLMKSA